jgi:hypothetical protein
MDDIYRIALSGVFLLALNNKQIFKKIPNNAQIASLLFTDSFV